MAKNSESRQQVAARRRIRTPDALLFFAAGLFFTWEIHAFVTAGRQTASGLPDNYGNFDRITRSIEERPLGESFSFAVAGDPHSSSTFVRLCSRLRQEPLSFVVIVGDFAKRCRKPYHDFFRHQCRNAYGLSVPVLLAPGNRDVDYNSRYDNNISREEYAAMYGPLNFAFEYGGCLFIGLAVFPRPTPSADSLQFLETTLAARRRDNQKVFVFMHPPAMFRPGIPAGYFQDCPQFVDIVKRYKVDYVISGHHHGYNAAEWAGTTYLVTAGGGAPLKEKQSFAGLHHGLVFTVDPGGISQKAVLVRRRHMPAYPLAWLSLVKLHPALARHPVDAAILNLAILVVVSPAVGRYLPVKRRSRRCAANKGRHGDLAAVTCTAPEGRHAKAPD